MHHRIRKSARRHVARGSWGSSQTLHVGVGVMVPFDATSDGHIAITPAETDTFELVQLPAHGGHISKRANHHFRKSSNANTPNMVQRRRNAVSNAAI